VQENVDGIGNVTGKVRPSCHSGCPSLSVIAVNSPVEVTDVQWFPSLGDFGIMLVYLYTCTCTDGMYTTIYKKM
jgi:hypothetical protein